MTRDEQTHAAYRAVCGDCYMAQYTGELVWVTRPVGEYGRSGWRRVCRSCFDATCAEMQRRGFSATITFDALRAAQAPYTGTVTAAGTGGPGR